MKPSILRTLVLICSLSIIGFIFNVEKYFGIFLIGMGIGNVWFQAMDKLDKSEEKSK